MGFKEYIKEYKDYLSKYDLVFLLLIGIILFMLPYLFTLNCKFFPDFNGTEDGTGQIGDTIGGITAPFIGFFSAVLVYLAFKAQIHSNKIIQEQFNVNLIIETINKQTLLVEKSIELVNISIEKNKFTEKFFNEESIQFESNNINKSGIVALQYFNKLCMEISDEFSLKGLKLNKEYSNLSIEENQLFKNLKDFLSDRNTSKFIIIFTKNLEFLNKLIKENTSSENKSINYLYDILNFQFDFEEIRRFLINGIEFYKYCLKQKELEFLKIFYNVKIKSLQNELEKINLIYPDKFFPPILSKP
jgi:hypothetical protein